jgi:uncharacterized membrane protein
MKNDYKTPISSIILGLIVGIFNAIGQILFKYTANNMTSIFSLLFNGYFYLSLMCYGLGFILLLWALKKGEATIIYPILASAFIWISFLSPVLFLNDFMSIQKWIGIFIIICGVYAIVGGRE